MTSYVEYIDRNTVKPAKLPLKEIYEENGEMRQRLIFNPTEADYNRNGLYQLFRDVYPDDGYIYTPYYEKDGLFVRQHWEQGEKIETTTDPTSDFMHTLSSADTNSIAKIRQAAKDFLAATEGIE